MHRIFPFILWLPQLRRREVWRRDLIAGVTVAAVIIPQSMAYARLAGLPAVYGLYAAFIPPVIAALWGSSRHLATGPVAMASLISAATVGALAAADSDAYITYSVLLALMVGVIRLLMGVLRLGDLVNFLSAPVVIGFANAAAIVIATSQLSNVLGVRAVSIIIRPWPMSSSPPSPGSTRPLSAWPPWPLLSSLGSVAATERSSCPWRSPQCAPGDSVSMAK